MAEAFVNVELADGEAKEVNMDGDAASSGYGSPVGSYIVDIGPEKQVVEIVDFTMPNDLEGEKPENIYLDMALDQSGSMYMVSAGNKDNLSNRELSKTYTTGFIGMLKDGVWPKLKEKNVANHLQLRVRWFTERTQDFVDDYVDIDGDIAVGKLLESIRANDLTGTTMFKPFLDAVEDDMKEDGREGPRLLIICSDGGCFAPLETMAQRDRLVEQGLAIDTYGFGSWVSQSLMNNLATRNCALFPCLDDKFMELLLKNTVRSLTSISKRHEVVLHGAELLTVQALGHTLFHSVPAQERADYKRARSCDERGFRYGAWPKRPCATCHRQTCRTSHAKGRHLCHRAK